MPIYGVKLTGRNKRVLVKAESAAKAKDLFVEAKSLTAEEMSEAIEKAESVWKPGTPLPPDEPEQVEEPLQDTSKPGRVIDPPKGKDTSGE